jgi:hypothetical protein
MEITSIFFQKMKEYLFLCQKSPLTTICFLCDFYHLSSISSDELVIFLSFFFPKDVYVHRFCVDVAMPLLCAALFLFYGGYDQNLK